MKSVARRAGYYSRTEDAFGRTVDNYDGIPMQDMEDYYDGSKTTPVVAIESDHSTSIYAVCLGMDGFHGISPTGNKVIKSYLPDLKAPGAVKKGEVEALVGTVLKDTKKAAVFRGIIVEAGE